MWAGGGMELERDRMPSKGWDVLDGAGNKRRRATDGLCKSVRC